MSEKHLLGVFDPCCLCPSQKGILFPCAQCEGNHGLCPACLAKMFILNLLDKKMRLSKTLLRHCPTQELLTAARLSNAR